MFKLVALGVHQIHYWSYAKITFLAGLACQEVLNTVGSADYDVAPFPQ